MAVVAVLIAMLITGPLSKLEVLHGQVRRATALAPHTTAPAATATTAATAATNATAAATNAAATTDTGACVAS